MSQNMVKIFHPIEDALEALKRGEIIIVCDDENRENEGDFIMAADKVTPEAINFMATHGRGLICAPLSSDRAKKLELDYMVPANQGLDQTPFTVSIDYGPENTTGISSQDRSNTIAAMLKEDINPADFIRPGHIFPLIANDKGVLARPGHTEATVDLMKYANLQDVGVICEIMNEDGTMARVDDLKIISEKWNLKMITIKDLITYRLKHEYILNSTEQIPLPTKWGEFQMKVFSPARLPEIEITAVFKGNIDNAEDLPVRIHSQCQTGDTFGSLRCDCGEQLEQSLRYIQEQGKGLIIYLPQEGRNIGLANKVRAYALQDMGHDTVEANQKLGLDVDGREYTFAQQILKFWQLQKIKLITFNPDKINQLQELGIDAEQLVLESSTMTEFNKKYLETKIKKLGHDKNLMSSPRGEL